MKIVILEKGYVALSTVLVVGVILVGAGIAVTLNSINDVQSSFSETQKERELGFVSACVQDSLIRINKNNVLPASFNLPEGSCTVTINSHVGNVWDFTVTGTLSGYRKSIRVVANRTTSVTITSWLEI